MRLKVKNAISGGNIAAIKLLFKSGANITDRDHGTNCQTPLQFAVYSGELKIIPYLVKDGADVNAPPSRVEGRIALHEAAARKEAGHRAIMQSIIARLKADKVPGVNW
jgi:ankyrin repeat protein